MKYSYAVVLGILVMAMILAVGCEEQPVTVSDGELGCTGNICKNVLIEDLTGVRCPNCPKGSAQLEDMINRFGADRIIPVGIHGGFLSAPFPDSKFNFENDYAREVEQTYAFLGKPAGVFNRVQFEDEPLISNADSDEWPVLAERELETPARAIIELDHAYDGESRELDMRVVVTGIEDVDQGLAVSIWFTQSDMVDKQESVGEVLSEYVHKHVLIGGATAALGDPLVESLAADQVVERVYTYTLPEEDGLWKADDMEIIAFVHSTSGDSREVLFTTHVKVVE